MKDISQAVPDAAAFDRDLVNELQTAVGHTTVIVTAKARSEHRWQHRTGATRESIVGAVSDSGKGAKGTVNVGENAARLATGTAPHRIEAHDRKTSGGRDASGRFKKGGSRPGVLAFPMGGTTMFRRAVNHPGTQPDPYLDAAAEAAGEELAVAVEHALDKALGS